MKSNKFFYYCKKMTKCINEPPVPVFSHTVLLLSQNIAPLHEPKGIGHSITNTNLRLDKPRYGSRKLRPNAQI